MHGYRNTNIKHTPRTLHRALHAHQKVSIHIKYFLGRIKKLKKKIFLTNFSQIEQGVANGEPGVQADISVRTVNISDTFSLKRCTNGDRHP